MTSRKASAPTLVTRLQPRTKLFVLDTNVLMHDPTSLFRFEEHDIYMPDGDARRTRQQQEGHVGSLAQRAPGEPLSRRDRVRGDRRYRRRGSRWRTPAPRKQPDACSCRPNRSRGELPARLATGKADNQIIGVVKHLQESQDKRQVILVSKDINMRIKARALGFAAEDYFNDKVLEDTDLLYTGVRELPADFWDEHGKEMESWQQRGPHVLSRARPALRQFHGQRIRLPGRRKTVLRPGQGTERQDRDPADPQGVHAPEATMSGASLRATASRTSR